LRLFFAFEKERWRPMGPSGTRSAAARQWGIRGGFSRGAAGRQWGGLMRRITQGGVAPAIHRKTDGVGRTFLVVTGPHRGAFPVTGLKQPR
jgi:hypothetical protein